MGLWENEDVSIHIKDEKLNLRVITAQYSFPIAIKENSNALDLRTAAYDENINDLSGNINEDSYKKRILGTISMMQ